MIDIKEIRLKKFDDIKNLEILKPKNNMGWIVTCIKKS